MPKENLLPNVDLGKMGEKFRKVCEKEDYTLAEGIRDAVRDWLQKKNCS